MSTVLTLKCPVCNPESRDYPVRRVVNVSGEELYNFVHHVINEHTSLRADVENAQHAADAAAAVANEARAVAETPKTEPASPEGEDSSLG